MTTFNHDEYIKDLDHTERLLTTFLTDSDAAIDMLMELKDANELRGVVAALLGYIRGNTLAVLEANPGVSMEKLLTDIRIGFLEQRVELDT